MALILKQGKTFNNPYDGITSDAYLNIKQINGNDNRKDKRFTVEIYASESYKQTDARPIYSESITVVGDEWDTWFAPSVLEAANCNQNKQAYAYLLQIENLDENGESYDPKQYKWGDWESTPDEV